MKRIMITGGAGFIGSALARHLILSTKNHVLVVDKLTYAGNLASLKMIEGSDRYAFARQDICDAQAMAILIADFAPNIIVHLAAESHVDRSIDEPSAFIQTNVVGTSVILEAALDYWRKSNDDRRASFRFHHVSTDEVFGTLAAFGHFDETSPYSPRSPYSASKASADHLVRAWHATYGLPISITNCSNNYGPYHFPEKLIPLTIVNGIEGKPLPVYGTGNNVRDWLYVEDHVSALLKVMELGAIGQTYCIGGQNEWSNLDVVRKVCSILDELSPDSGIGPRAQLIHFVPDRIGHDFRYAIDASKISNELGWVARESFDSGLRQTVDWYLSNRDWWQDIRSRGHIGDRLGMQRSTS